MGVKHIFLVDDDQIFRTATTVLLQRELQEIQISEFKNGMEVYDKLMELEKKPEALPDIILLDINMPLMNGWEFLEELKGCSPELYRSIDIHILTSSIAPEDLNLSLTYDFIKGYITKPFTIEDVRGIFEVLKETR